jgi:hypothetical protein
MKKTRIMVQLDKIQIEAIAALRQRTGASVAEIVRRAVDLYVEKNKKK